MAAAGRPLDEAELVEYILTGLNAEFESLATAVFTRVKPIGLEKLYSQMLSFETRMNLMYAGNDQSSTNWAGRGSCGGARGTGRGGRGRGFVPVCGRGNQGGNTNNSRQGGGYQLQQEANLPELL